MNLFLINPIKNRNLFAFLMFRQVNNKIVNADIINALGIKTTRPVNAEGVYSLNGDINWGLAAFIYEKEFPEYGPGHNACQEQAVHQYRREPYQRLAVTSRNKAGNEPA